MSPAPLSPAAQDHLVWGLWGFLAVLTAFGVWKLAQPPETIEESDRIIAMRDQRRAEVQARMSGGFWKRAEKRLFGVKDAA